MKRRDFLKEVVAVPTVVAAWKWYGAADPLCRKRVEISAVLYDERYADSRAFATALERQGVRSFATFGDAASVWYGALRATRARSGGSIAGMATDSDWVVSRACGREQGLGVAYEGSHDWRVPDRLVHRLYGNGLEREVYSALLDLDTVWYEAVASALLRAGRAERVKVGRSLAIADAATRVFTGHPGYLTSWLLDPSVF